MPLPRSSRHLRCLRRAALPGALPLALLLGGLSGAGAAPLNEQDGAVQRLLNPNALHAQAVPTVLPRNAPGLAPLMEGLPASAPPSWEAVPSPAGQAPRWSAMADVSEWLALSPVAAVPRPAVATAPRDLGRPLGAGQAATEPGPYALLGASLLVLALLLRRRRQ